MRKALWRDGEHMDERVLRKLTCHDCQYVGSMEWIGQLFPRCCLHSEEAMKVGGIVTFWAPACLDYKPGVPLQGKGVAAELLLLRQIKQELESEQDGGTDDRSGTGTEQGDGPG